MLEVGIQSAFWFDWADPDGSCKRGSEAGIVAVDFGFPGVSTKNDPITSFYDKSLEEIIAIFTPFKAAFEKYGMIISQCHAPFPLWVKDRPEFNDYMIMVMEKICAVCEFINCPAIVAHNITRSTKEKEWDTNMEMYGRMAPAAIKHGVKICLENLFGTFHGHVIGGTCSAPEEAVKYIDTLNERAGAECFGFCLDTGHANLVGADIRKFINMLGHRLTCLHIHDNNGVEDVHQLPYTQTHNWGAYTYLDWEGFINGLRDINYQGSLCFETFRVLELCPKPVWPEMMRTITAMGRYFRDRVLAPAEEQA